MEFIILLLLFIAFLVPLYTGIKAVTERRIQGKAEQILDKKFDGSETATYRIDSTTGLRYEQVLLGAEQRGYKLYSKNNDTKYLTTLVFKRQSSTNLADRVSPYLDEK